MARRVLICLVGAFIYASGVCVLASAALGISPISSVPYVATFATGLSLGACTMGLNVILIILQKIMSGKEYILKTLIMQIAISIVFSVFIDFNIFLFGWFKPQVYLGKIAYLIFGCAVLAIGMSLVVMANFVVLPGEGVVKCIAKLWKKEFGTAKIFFDCSMVAVATVTSLITLHRIEGIREGTVIASILIGTFSKFIMRRFKHKMDVFLGFEVPENSQTEASTDTIPIETLNNNKVKVEVLE